MTLHHSLNSSSNYYLKGYRRRRGPLSCILRRENHWYDKSTRFICLSCAFQYRRGCFNCSLGVSLFSLLMESLLIVCGDRMFPFFRLSDKHYAKLNRYVMGFIFFVPLTLIALYESL